MREVESSKNINPLLRRRSRHGISPRRLYMDMMVEEVDPPRTGVSPWLVPVRHLVRYILIFFYIEKTL